MENQFPEPAKGGRLRLWGNVPVVNAFITNSMLPEIGREFFSRLAAGSEIKRVHVTAKEGNFVYAFD